MNNITNDHTKYRTRLPTTVGVACPTPTVHSFIFEPEIHQVGFIYFPIKQKSLGYKSYIDDKSEKLKKKNGLYNQTKTYNSQTNQFF